MPRIRPAPSALLLACCLLAGACPVPAALAATGTVTVLTIIDVVPDRVLPGDVQASAALLDALARASRSTPGAVAFDVLRDASRPNHFAIISVWSGMPAFEAYTGAVATRRFRTAFQPRLASPFDERVYRDLPP